jgi:hypothetical protein
MSGLLHTQSCSRLDTAPIGKSGGTPAISPIDELGGDQQDNYHGELSKAVGPALPGRDAVHGNPGLISTPAGASDGAQCRGICCSLSVVIRGTASQREETASALNRLTVGTGRHLGSPGWYDTDGALLERRLTAVVPLVEDGCFELAAGLLPY